MDTCRACGELQPGITWDNAPPEQRYCGVCCTPACDDDTLDRLQSQQLAQSPARLYGTSLVSPTPEVVAFMAGWDVATKGAADQALVPFDLWVNRAHTRMLVAQAILTPAQGQAICVVSTSWSNAIALGSLSCVQRSRMCTLISKNF